MTLAIVLDALSLFCLSAGALLCLTAAVGVARFDDYLSRLHAAAKPQTLGVLMVLLGVGLRLHSPLEVSMLILVGVFQLITVPAAGHMTSRGYFRSATTDPQHRTRERGNA